MWAIYATFYTLVLSGCFLLPYAIFIKAKLTILSVSSPFVIASFGAVIIQFKFFEGNPEYFLFTGASIFVGLLVIWIFLFGVTKKETSPQQKADE
jgi:ABC-type Fe3+-siderophore transport system permease subunit